MNFNFDTVDVKDAVVTAFLTELPIKGYPDVRVLKSDPQSPAEFPCIGVNRTNDDETSMSIADSNGVSYDAGTQVYTTEQGTFFTEGVEIRVWHTNADERDKLYRVVKAILFAYRMAWVTEGLLNVTLSGGRDEQDSSMANAPVVVYWGVINMNYLNPLNVDILQTGVAPITKFTAGTTLSFP